MTRGELAKFLEDQAREYHLDAMDSIRRNSHMNECEEKDFDSATQKCVDAILVDFINKVMVSQCLDLGLYVKDLYQERKNAKES